MHILYLIDGLSLGGAETVVINTLNYLKQTHPSLQISLITTFTDESHLIHKLDATINYEHIDCRRINFFWGILNIRKYIKENNVSHIHTHLYHSIIVGRIVKNPKTFLFETFHNLEYNKKAVYYSWWRVIADKLTYNKASFSIYVSEEVAQSVQRIRSKNKQFIVLNNFAGLNFSYNYQFKKNSSLKLIAIGNLKADKNFKYALNAFTSLKQYPISLDIYGEGSLRTEIEDYINANNIKVKLMGRRQMEIKILKDYDAFLMTSLNEGMPISLLEAMGVGLPSILPNHLSVMKEVAQNSARYFSINNCKELPNVLVEILENKEMLLAMSEEAAIRSRLYNIDTHVSKLFDFYSKPRESKVLFILQDFARGGAERVFVNIANGLFDMGISVKFIVGKKTGTYIEFLNPAIKITEINTDNLLQALKALPKILVNEEYTHIFTASDKFSVAAVVIKKLFRLKSKIIPTLHYDLPYQISILPLLNQLYLTLTNRFIISKADTIVAVSNGVRKGFQKIAKRNVEQLITIYNPVFNEGILNASCESVEEQIFFNNYKTLISIGKLTNIPKNQELLIKAFYILCKTQNNLQLIFLGEGGDKDRYIELTKNLGVADKVHFLGFKTNPYKYIVQSDLLVLSSDTEGFGNVIVEALALGVNVVSTDCPSGPKEILENGKYGFLSPVNDPIKLAEAIEKALKHPIDSNILKCYAQKFSSSNIIEKYFKLLE